MRNLLAVCLAGAAIGLCVNSAAQAQDPPEKSRTYCDITDAKNNCPGAKCVCTEDTLEVTFDGNTDSVFVVENFQAGAAVDTTLVMDVKSGDGVAGNGVQGWSYGVDHDDAYLTLGEVTVTGTDAEFAKSHGGFVVADSVNIETCKGEAPPACKNPLPATGYISAIILSFTEAASLEKRRNTLVKAKYTLAKEPDATGTLIDVTERLKKAKSPPTDINITVAGASKSPITIVDGWVVKAGGPPVENCTNGTDDDGDTKIDCADEDCAADPACVPKVENCTNGTDDDGDTKIDCADEDCATNPACVPTECDDYAYYFGPAATAADVAVGAGAEYVISMRNKAASLGFQLGVKAATAGGTTTWTFAGTLGTDADRLIELIITDDQGNSQTAKAGNKATSSTSTVAEIIRGAATDGLKTRDFLAFDLAPGVGGPGFTVGYVADTNPAGQSNKIAATGTGTPCPVNEILKVKLGTSVGKPFSRGDANGDTKINVTDAVLIIQIAVGLLTQKVDCKDALDANDDGSVNVADAIPVLAYVFQKGPKLAEPFKKCAVDPTDTDGLTCAASNCQ